MRYLIALPLLLAAAPAGFIPGLWQLSSAPGTATLDGQPLGDLPYTGPGTPPTVCLTAAQARDPAWLARGLAIGCTVTRRSLARGRIDLAATCPPQAQGLASGTIRVTGRWTPTSYALRFTTRNPSENGVMGFTGTMTGKRVGICPVL